MFYETAKGHPLAHDPFKALVAPRPIAWVGSLSASGALNLAPFSYFNAVADDPPAVMFAPSGPRRGGGAEKDTLENVEESGEFVVNIPTWELREAMNATSAHAPRGTSEFELAGLTPAPSRLVKPPRIEEALVSLECRYLFRVVLPSGAPEVRNNVVFGEVLGVHVADSIIADGRIAMERYRPIARLGYMDYTVVERVFTMIRPD